MSYTNTILQAMRYGREYTQAEVQAITQLPADSVRQVLQMLVKGNLIEVDDNRKYKRNKKYKTRQRELFKEAPEPP